MLVCHLAAAALLVSFFYDPAESLWDAVDHAVFRVLNGTVFDGPAWQAMVAFANTKLYDKLSTLALIGVLLGFVLCGGRGNAAGRLGAVMFIGLYMVLFTYGRRKLGLFEMGRASPSLVAEPFFDLREAFAELKPKTSSGSSFPGDHGIAVMIYASLFWYFAGRRWGLFSLLLAPAFIMPRLIGGGHWLSDIIVGGGFYALVVVSWALCTPLGGKACGAFARGLEGAGQRVIAFGLLPQRHGDRGGPQR